MIPPLLRAPPDSPPPPPPHGRAIAERIPPARFEILDGAAHLANLERGEELVRLYLEHLQ